MTDQPFERHWQDWVDNNRCPACRQLMRHHCTNKQCTWVVCTDKKCHVWGDPKRGRWQGVPKQ